MPLSRQGPRWGGTHRHTHAAWPLQHRDCPTSLHPQVTGSATAPGLLGPAPKEEGVPAPHTSPHGALLSPAGEGTGGSHCSCSRAQGREGTSLAAVGAQTQPWHQMLPFPHGHRGCPTAPVAMGLLLPGLQGGPWELLLLHPPRSGETAARAQSSALSAGFPVFAPCRPARSRAGSCRALA